MERVMAIWRSPLRVDSRGAVADRLLMEINITDKRAIITGGSGGIGGALSRTFAAVGAKVCVSYHSNRDSADQTVKEIEASGGEAFSVKADVTKNEEVLALFSEMDSRYGGVDILVNCAGIDGKKALSWEIEPEEFQKVIMVNLMGAFLCTREALRRMIKQKSGVVLNVSSVHEVIPWTGHTAYTAAKAGLAMMTQSISQEVAERGVRVLTISPGAIRTPINQDVWSDPEQMADLNTKIPMNRIGEAEEVAKVALMMCSDWGSYMTGSSVFVDGGMTNYPSFRHGG